jgi:hypothetical protein
MSSGAGPRVAVNTLDEAIEKGLLVAGISHSDVIGAVCLADMIHISQEAMHCTAPLAAL